MKTSILTPIISLPLALLLSACGPIVSKDKIQSLIQQDLTGNREVTISTLEEQQEKEQTSVSTSADVSRDGGTVSIGKPVTVKYFAVMGSLKNLVQGYAPVATGTNWLSASLSKDTPLPFTTEAQRKIISDIQKTNVDCENIHLNTYNMYSDAAKNLRPGETLADQAFSDYSPSNWYEYLNLYGKLHSKSLVIKDVYAPAPNEAIGSTHELKSTLKVYLQANKVVKMELMATLGFGEVPIPLVEKTETHGENQLNPSSDAGKLINFASSVNSTFSSLNTYYGVATKDIKINNYTDDNSLARDLRQSLNALTDLTNKERALNSKLKPALQEATQALQKAAEEKEAQKVAREEARAARNREDAAALAPETIQKKKDAQRDNYAIRSAKSHYADILKTLGQVPYVEVIGGKSLPVTLSATITTPDTATLHLTGVSTGDVSWEMTGKELSTLSQTIAQVTRMRVAQKQAYLAKNAPIVAEKFDTPPASMTPDAVLTYLAINKAIAAHIPASVRLSGNSK